MTTPAPVPVPTVFESLEAKAIAYEQIFTTHLSAISAKTLADIKALMAAGQTLPAGLSEILPELEQFGSDFFTLVQLVSQVLAVKAIPVTPPTPPAA